LTRARRGAYLRRRRRAPLPPRRRTAPRHLHVAASSVCGCSDFEFESASRSRRNPAIGSLAPRRRLAVALATAGGAGYSPVAPGTAGSAVGVGLYWILAPAGTAIVVGTALALLVLGVLAADVVESLYGRSDDGRIVIDEVVGQLLALAPLPWLAHDPRSPWLLAAGFLAFRLFDIWKPGPARWAERHFEGGKGVMFDDVFAGLFAGACVAALAVFAGGPA
jgi:phosphatidylglycerophosphatase A